MKLIRHTPRGVQYTLVGGQDDSFTHVKTGDKELIINFNIERLNQSWYDWTCGNKLVQNAFPYLNDSEREFLITGMTDREWNDMFSDV